MAITTAPTPRDAGPIRALAIALFVALWLGAQIALPLWQRRAVRQTRFSWQMFSGGRANPNLLRGLSFVGVNADGRPTRLRPQRYFVRYRTEMNPGARERLLAHICRTEPSLRSVEVRRSDTVVVCHPCSAGGR